jgi:hypothetical protein
MREMGWSWEDLMATPAVVVQEISFRLSEQIHWTSVKSRLEQEGVSDA